MGEPILTTKIDTTVINIYEDLAKITDSLLLESGIIIATLKDTETNNTIEIKVCGQVKINFKGDWYRYPSDYPDELTEMIKDGSVYDNDDVYVDMNNWFEIFYNGDEWSDVVDVEGQTPQELTELLRQINIDY